MYAIVETGGKQYKVSKDDLVEVERLAGKIGKEVKLDKVLLCASGKTVDVGTLASESGDEDGFLDGASVAAIAVVGPSLANAAVTRGALLREDEDGAGAYVPSHATGQGGKSVTYTLGAADFAELVGNIVIDFIEIE